MTIRRLTIDDWTAIEAVLDTRKKFQTTGMSDELHGKLKQNYVKSRLERGIVFLFGYFVDDSLMAISSFHAGSLPGHFVAGITWTKAGSNLPRWPECQHYASAIIELRNFCVEYFENEYFMEYMWIIGPADTTWERLIEVPGCVLADTTKYERKTISTIKANEWSIDPFINRFVLVNHTLPTDQVVFLMTNLHPKSRLPADAPKRMDTPTPHLAPPKALIPTPHEMP